MRAGKLLAWFTMTVLAAAMTFSAGCGSGNSDDLPTTSLSGDSGGSGETATGVGNANPQPLSANPQPGQSPVKPNPRPEVVIKTSLGDIKVRLDAEKAPITVDNFLENYVDQGIYDKTAIHYVENDFMIMGGGFSADLTPVETRSPIRNEANNGLANTRGAIAMVRDPQWIDSATSQFFINLSDNENLDHKSREAEEYGYCVFGEVVEGMDVVDRIAGVDVADQPDFPNVPTKPVLIESIRRVN